MWKQLGLVCLLIHIAHSVPLDSPTKDSIEVTEKPSDSTLKIENSDKEIVKVKEELATTSAEKLGTSAEKLGTSATVPIGYASPDEIGYGGAPGLTSGAYSAFGPQPHLYVPEGHFKPQGAQIQMAHHGGLLQPGYNGIGQAQRVEQFGGVVYGGNGAQQFSQQHQQVAAVSPFGDVTKKSQTVNTFGVRQPYPYSPYGHGGVVYMGNGLIPEHIAGVKPVGPVLPPGGYQQENVLVNKQYEEVGPSGQYRTSAVKNAVAVGHGGYNPQFFHPNQGYIQGIPPSHLTVNRASRVTGVDGYGNVNDFKVKERYDAAGAPGLGYNNGYQADVIHHTDRAILADPYQRRGFGPDPYFNNEPYPGYQRHGIGHATTLLTTGPNRYYQGKNPIGVYERIHRLG